MELKTRVQKKTFHGRNNFNKQIQNETQHQPSQQTITTSTTSAESNQTATLVTLQAILHKLINGLDRIENKLDNLINKVREPKIEFINLPKPAKAEINKIVANPKIMNQCQSVQERAEILENKGHQMNVKITYMPFMVKPLMTQAQLNQRFSEVSQFSQCQWYPVRENKTRQLPSARAKNYLGQLHISQQRSSPVLLPQQLHLLKLLSIDKAFSLRVNYLLIYQYLLLYE